MIRLHLNPEDLLRVRFAASPLWETITSLRTLTSSGADQLNGRWRRHVRTRLSDLDMPLLTSLVRPTGYIPDFLVPTPAGRAATFDDELSVVTATNPDTVAFELTHLANHPVAQFGPGEPGRVALLHRLAEDRGAGLDRIADQLRRYWNVAVAPFWARIHALLRDDLDYRLEQLAEGGIAQLFTTLHPNVSLDGSTVQVVKYYDGDTDLRDRGLLLIGCVFAWPDVIVRTAEPGTPSLTYAPIGVGRLWTRHPTTAGSALAAVLGRTRADLMSVLDVPTSTTQLAAQLQLSAPTLNAHLKALHRAGLLTTRRAGRNVLYRRTPLGDSLLEQGT